ncbi:beta-ketoacyl-ACP synthase III [Anaeroselena agilis]|uniref:Beta-ketoacyl-[acyl-carrier-protein] synthase III n=1 Tax=Anaeroselena agilis TaxID=3063788 RepID=A0ABU3NWR0_9FIRM|nr:beta-ketoacyl-ACP synthase III [Selenomonadales bacterium 4137-cl]
MKTDMGVGILGLGIYVPEKILTNKDLEKMVDTSDEWIVERTGIRERRIVDPSMATSDLATRAAEKALAEAKTSPDEIDLIIVATATPDMFFPSTACLVQANLKADNAAAFDLAAGCSGFMYGINTGAQFIKTGLYKKILVIGAETLTRIMDYTDRNTCVLFGDGAGAVVLGECPPGCGIIGFNMGADGAGGDLLKLPAGGSRLPATAETVANRQHFVHMNGNEVFKFAVKVMGESAFKALDHAGLSAADVDILIPHQANIRIIQSAAKRLKLPMEKVIVNVDRYGNTSSASIPIALREAIDDGRVKDGDVIVAVGFGAGLTWASCVIKWCKEAKTIA